MKVKAEKNIKQKFFDINTIFTKDKEYEVKMVKDLGKVYLITDNNNELQWITNAQLERDFITVGGFNTVKTHTVFDIIEKGDTIISVANVGTVHDIAKDKGFDNYVSVSCCGGEVVTTYSGAKNIDIFNKEWNLVTHFGELQKVL